MKIKVRFISLTLGLASIVSLPLQAEEAHHVDKAIEQSNQSMSTCEVKKINKEQGKVTLKHGELKNLGMPPMTMVFHVKEPAMLDKLVVGKTIKFMAENINGALTVVKIN